MNVEEILCCFKNVTGSFPTEALNLALAKQEEITPYLLEILKNIISSPDSFELDRMDHIFSLYLLSKFREKKAFPFIIAFASLSSNKLEELFGDCITEGVPRFIISTFNGDLLSIKKVIENEKNDKWYRGVGLRSLLGLFALGFTQRDELINYFRSLFYSKHIDDMNFASHLVNVCSDFYPEELKNEINMLFGANKVDTDIINKEWVEDVLRETKEKCLSKYIYNNHICQPIDDVEAEMCWMSAFTEFKSMYDVPDYFMPEIAVAYTRSAPKIGRNDPCFCGSGKKFKKCCLH